MFNVHRKIRFAIPMIIGGIIIALIMAFIFGWVVMLLWNWLMPELFNLPEISYWQGWGLVLLAHILFKGDFHRHIEHRDRWKDKARDKLGKSSQPETD
jgi:high-affinity Fe2+/Pb2+ permease